MKITEHNYYRLLLPIVFLLGFGFVLHAQSNPWIQAGQNFLQSEVLGSSMVGFQVIELDSRKVLTQEQADKLFVPASILKSWYTLAAIDQLGAGYRFITHIKTNGKLLPDGSLEGDLIIEASGDPSLASDRFGSKYDLDHFLNAIYILLKKKGIRCIDGSLILHMKDSCPSLSGDWLWEDIANYYGGGAWGFNFNENAFEATFQVPSRAGKRTNLLNIEPLIPFLTLQNEVISGEKGSGDQAYFYGGPNDYHKVIRGTLAAGLGQYTIQGAIPNPPLSFLHLLQRYLEDKGIFVEEISINEQGSYPGKVLGSYQSPTLIEIAKKCMDYSINLYSEALGKLLLAHHGKLPEKTYPSKEGWKAVFSPYSSVVGMQLADACGLSHSNLISPSTMNAFLLEMIDLLGKDKVLQVFPQNGRDGSARSFLPGKEFENNLWIKSGSLSGVMNYTGLFQSVSDQKYYLFTITTNHNRFSTQKTKSEIKKLIKAWMKLEM